MVALESSLISLISIKMFIRRIKVCIETCTVEITDSIVAMFNRCPQLLGFLRWRIRIHTRKIRALVAIWIRKGEVKPDQDRPFVDGVDRLLHVINHISPAPTVSVPRMR